MGVDKRKEVSGATWHHGSLVSVSKDDRRELREYQNPGGFSVQQFEIFRQVPLGNEFHKKRSEVFVVTKGGGTVFLCRVSEDGAALEEPTELTITAPEVIWIPPLTAHTLLMDPGTQLTCYVNRPFEPKDRYPFQLA